MLRSNTCALRATGEVVCWGVHTPSGAVAATPVRVEGVEGAVEITAGWHHDCARLASAKVLCWGDNQRGALGDGTIEPRSGPVEVLGLDATSSSSGCSLGAPAGALTRRARGDAPRARGDAKTSRLRGTAT